MDKRLFLIPVIITVALIFWSSFIIINEQINISHNENNDFCVSKGYDGSISLALIDSEGFNYQMCYQKILNDSILEPVFIKKGES